MQDTTSYAVRYTGTAQRARIARTALRYAGLRCDNACELEVSACTFDYTFTGVLASSGLEVYIHDSNFTYFTVC